MMQLYYVKSDLYGVPAGRVERFALHKAAPLVASGEIEPYDERKHGSKPGAPKQTADSEARVQALDEMTKAPRKR
jgi:hypothetical protein